MALPLVVQPAPVDPLRLAPHRIKRCTFRRMIRIDARGERLYDVECLYPDRKVPIPLGDLESATPICNACVVTLWLPEASVIPSVLADVPRATEKLLSVLTKLIFVTPPSFTSTALICCRVESLLFWSLSLIVPIALSSDAPFVLSRATVMG